MAKTALNIHIFYVFGKYLEIGEFFEKMFATKVVGNFFSNKKGPQSNFDIFNRYRGSWLKLLKIYTYFMFSVNILKSVRFLKKCFRQKLLEIFFTTKIVKIKIYSSCEIVPEIFQALRILTFSGTHLDHSILNR